MAQLTISNLHASIDAKEILKGISLTIKSKEVHAIMGPNGSGKSTLAYALMGHPSYKVQSFIKIDANDITKIAPNERAKLGLFLAFQNPLTVAGVPVASLLRTASQSIQGAAFNLPKKFVGAMSKKTNGEKKLSILEFNKRLEENSAILNLDKSFLRRGLNEGFSGGEKKKVEMLQALTLKPIFVIFDEIDTGLDIDALKTVAIGIRELVNQGSGVIIITHYQRILHYVKPNFVHILMNGQLVKSGGAELAEKIEKEGYTSVKR